MVPVNGLVLAVNTHETFKNLDRKQILCSAAQKVGFFTTDLLFLTFFWIIALLISLTY